MAEKPNPKSYYARKPGPLLIIQYSLVLWVISYLWMLIRKGRLIWFLGLNFFGLLRRLSLSTIGLC
jgi:hypothetical protein